MQNRGPGLLTCDLGPSREACPGREHCAALSKLGRLHGFGSRNREGLEHSRNF